MRVDIITLFGIAAQATINFALFQFSRIKSIFIYIYNNWLYFFGLLVRYSTLLYKVYFTELNAFEVNKTLAFKNSVSTNLNIIMHVFYSSRLQQKFIFLSHNTSSILSKTFNNLFQNITWPEREISEMFGISFLQKKDNRRLLLDFSFIGYPLLKSYPVTGYVELFYSVIEQWLVYNGCIFTEGEKSNVLYKI